MSLEQDAQRVNAMATARAIKAIRLYVEIGVMIGHPPTAADIRSMNDVGRSAAVRAAGVKVASEDTWRVTEAVAEAFEHANARYGEEAVRVAPKGIDGAVIRNGRSEVCQVPGCGCTGDAHP